MSSAATASDGEKGKSASNLARMVAEYQKVKGKNSVLKKAVVEEKRRTAELEAETQEKDRQLRRYMTESDDKGFRINSLTKRCEKLQRQLTVQKSEMEAAAAQQGSWVGSFFTGSGGGAAAGPEQDQTRRELDVAREELQRQILRNAGVHSELESLRADRESVVETLQRKLDDFKMSVSTLTEEVESLRSDNARLERQLATEEETSSQHIADLRAELEKTRQEAIERERSVVHSNKHLTAELQAIEARWKQKIVFDDSAVEHVNVWNLPVFNRTVVLSKMSVAKDCMTIFSSLGKRSSNLVRAVIQRLSASKVEQQTVLQLVTIPTELEQQSQTLVAALRDLVCRLERQANYVAPLVSSSTQEQGKDNDEQQQQQQQQQDEEEEEEEEERKQEAVSILTAICNFIGSICDFLRINLSLLAVSPAGGGASGLEAELSGGYRDVLAWLQQGLLALHDVADLQHDETIGFYGSWAMDFLLTRPPGYLSALRRGVTAVSTRFAAVCSASHTQQYATQESRAIDNAIVKEITAISNLIAKFSDRVDRYRAAHPPFVSLSAAGGGTKGGEDDDGELVEREESVPDSVGSDVRVLESMYSKSQAFLCTISTDMGFPAAHSVPYYEAARNAARLADKIAQVQKLSVQVEERGEELAALEAEKAELEKDHRLEIEEREAQLRELEAASDLVSEQLEAYQRQVQILQQQQQPVVIQEAIGASTQGHDDNDGDDNVDDNVDDDVDDDVVDDDGGKSSSEQSPRRTLQDAAATAVAHDDKETDSIVQKKRMERSLAAIQPHLQKQQHHRGGGGAQEEFYTIPAGTARNFLGAVEAMRRRDYDHRIEKYREKQAELQQQATKYHHELTHISRVLSGILEKHATAQREAREAKRKQAELKDKLTSVTENYDQMIAELTEALLRKTEEYANNVDARMPSKKKVF